MQHGSFLPDEPLQTTHSSSNSSEAHVAMTIPQEAGSQALLKHSSSGDERKASTRPQRKIFDWLVVPPPPNITPFQQSVHDVDWKSSSLGPIEGWPNWLKTMVALVVSDPSPAIIYVDGKDGIEEAIVYNEPCTVLIGDKHPSLQGMDPKIGFAEVWRTFSPILATGRDDFKTVVGDAQPLLLYRHGFFEETWFSWKFTPIIGPEGYVVGSHATVVEVTRDAILDRRMSSLRMIDQEASPANNLVDLWPRFMVAVEKCPIDIPFGLIYTRDGVYTGYSSDQGARSTTSSPRTCTLAGASCKKAFDAAPKTLELDSKDGLGSAFREAMLENSTRVVSTTSGTFPKELRHELSYGEILCDSGIVVPIQSPSSDGTLAFILLAQNPRRPYDTDYREFMNSIMRRISAIASRLLLSEQLSRKTQEFEEIEIKFSRFSSRAPIGLAVFAADGRILYANSCWGLMMQVQAYPGPDPKSETDPGDTFYWMQSIAEEDQEYVKGEWQRIMTEKNSSKCQIRLKTRRSALDGTRSDDTPITVLCSAFPDFDAEGNVHTIMSCLTDVSELDSVERQLRARTQELENQVAHVLELKNQQESFIDMTSHEIRNPLSAVLHLAEEIFTTSNDLMSGTALSGVPESHQVMIKAALRASIEASETINACVLHQKRIVDDILVLSRLDRDLLQVTLLPTQPKDLIQTSLKLFAAEVKTANISLEFAEHPSLHDLDIQWLLMDPVRVTQILVNLVGNAIKFTQSQDARRISVVMKATVHRPTDSSTDLHFVPNGHTRETAALSDCGDGEVLYLGLSVTDTGVGLSDEEQKMLFQRFSQGSRRTHTSYGGSGLGLWISKQLAELHGGQIGVASQEMGGSNFFFFVKTRRTSQPVGEDPGQNATIPHRDNHARAGVKQAAARLPGDQPLALHSGSQEGITPIPEASKALHILVVEDNLVNQMIIAKQLRKQGYIVHVANHGGEALRFLKTTTFWVGDISADEEAPTDVRVALSVVLMDLEMPVMNGITAIKRIRQLERDGQMNGHVPTLAVTANARGEQLQAALDAGMDGSITKPYRLAYLLEHIEQLARQKH